MCSLSQKRPIRKTNKPAINYILSHRATASTSFTSVHITCLYTTASLAGPNLIIFFTTRFTYLPLTHSLTRSPHFASPRINTTKPPIKSKCPTKLSQQKPSTESSPVCQRAEKRRTSLPRRKSPEEPERCFCVSAMPFVLRAE